MKWFTPARAALALLLAAPALHAQTMPGGSAAARAGFGMSLVVSGGQVIVGEPQNSLRPGTVYVYSKTGGAWTESGRITATDGAPTDGFGGALAANARWLVVGAAAQSNGGAAYVFQRQGNGWRQVARLTAADAGEDAAFGTAVAVAGDVVFVSAPRAAERAGAVYAFASGSGGWSQVAKVAAPQPVAEGLFGLTLAAADTRLVVGVPGMNENRGGAMVFERGADGVWGHAATLTSNQLQANDRLGSALALGSETVYAAAPIAGGRTGVVYVFGRTANGEWAPTARLAGFDTGGGYQFGAGVAQDAGAVWIGAPGANGARGAVYVATRDPAGWARMERLMPAVELSRGAGFGGDVAIDGAVAAASIVGDDFGAGSVAIFERGANGWTQQTVVKSPPEALASITGGEVRCGADGSAAGFDCRDVELVSFLSIPDLGGARGVNLNDVWGWTDPQSGKEYALVGRVDGTSFVDVSNPERPVYVGNLPLTTGATPNAWRDIKVYRDHAYVVADGAGAHGMQVIDLTRLRAFNGTPLQLTPDHTYRRINSAHNIVINEESGYAYAVGASSGGETCGGGLHMISLRDPKNPEFAGCFSDSQTGRASTGYSHDAQCVMYRGPDTRYTGREICLGSNETALSIADVTDKAAPKALSRASYPNVAYSHQGWLTEDQRYFFMNDELDEIGGVVDRTRTLVWDLSDLEDPQLILQHEGVEGATDHNLYIRDNLMYQSNYKSGLRILDVSNPRQPVEVGFFDTFPAGDNEEGFDGTWSNYPYFKSGIIIATGIGEGLFVLKKRNPATVF